MRISHCTQLYCSYEISACRNLCYSHRPKLFDVGATVPPRTTFRQLPLRVFPHRPSRCKARITAKKSESESQSALEEPGMADLSSVSKQSLVTGQLCLCGVAILWGSYSPVVRYIYSCPGPPTPAALTAVRTVIQAIALFLSDVILRQQQFRSPQKAKARRGITSPRVSSNYDSDPAVMGSVLSWLSTALQSTSSKLWIAGAELGFWNFCGSTFQALGLQYTSATRGAFLIQVSRMQPLQKSPVPYVLASDSF